MVPTRSTGGFVGMLNSSKTPMDLVRFSEKDVCLNRSSSSISTAFDISSMFVFLFGGSSGAGPGFSLELDIITFISDLSAVDGVLLLLVLDRTVLVVSREDFSGRISGVASEEGGVAVTCPERA